MIKISLALIVKNEEKTIKRCLESAKDTVDEIIVVDTGSTDKTVEIAQQFDSKIYHFEWANDFSKARNFALEKTTGDWILVLDADEYLRKNYKKELQNFAQKGEKVGKINIINKFEENNEIRYENSFISRFFPKGIEYVGAIHEQLDTNLTRENVSIEVEHDGYFQKNKSERNVPLLEVALKEDENDAYILYQLGREYRNGIDLKKADEYFRRSYKLINRKESFSPNLIVEYLNVLIKRNKTDRALNVIAKESEFLKNFPDFHFATGLFYMDYLSKNPNVTMNELFLIEKSFLNCLRIGENHNYDGVMGMGSFLAEYNLGVFYEVLGQLPKAKTYYKKAANRGYELAKNRLKNF